MKLALYTFTVIIFCLAIGDENQLGKYLYTANRFYESIELKENNKFIYYSKQEFISYEIKGNYSLNGDSLTLDSSPQKDRIIVKESNKGKQSIITILVTDKFDNAIHYDIHFILTDNSEVSLKEQWQKSKIKNKKIKAFYITDTKGLKSPIYYKQGKFSNFFKVLFEPSRIFENERWYIKNNKIKPKGLNGEFQNYFLAK